ncbi:MAG TPA: membrane dipeptidase, partial [Steroidobacteraceae bacterium]|nr:membrane dipeptidase [Steroidobacteraceae bacterium]
MMRRTHFGAAGARLVLALAAILACATAHANGPAHADGRALDEARAILSRHPLIDGHNDLPMVIRESGKPPRDVVAYDLGARTAGDTDIARLRAGGVGGQFWSVYVPSAPEAGARGFARIQL